MPIAPPQRPVKLFYSYSHADEDSRDRLEDHLATLKREGSITSWHDRKIPPGKEWGREIDHHLLTADIVLLLVSVDFLNSDYCWSVEMHQALRRHERNEATVIPVFLDYCDWKGTPFAKLQGLPADAEPVTSKAWVNIDEAFAAIACGIRKALGELSTRIFAQPSQFARLNLGFPNSGTLVNRKQELGDIVTALKTRTRPVVVIGGMGGIGKTAVALMAAHSVFTQQIFEYGVWCSDSPRSQLTLEDLLDEVATTLGAAPLVLENHEAKPQSVRRLLASNRCLLVVDSVQPFADQRLYDFLGGIPRPSCALVTARQRLPLDEMRFVALDRLADPHALQFLATEARNYGHKLGTLKDKQEIVNAAGGMPLAMKWAVSQICNRGATLEDVLQQLRGAKGDIFTHVLGETWTTLPVASQLILKAMTFFSAPASRSSVRAVADLNEESLKDGVAALVQRSLIDLSDEITDADQRLTVLSVTSHFARQHLAERKEEQELMWRRYVEFFPARAEELSRDKADPVGRLEKEVLSICGAWKACYVAEDWGAVLRFRVALREFLWMRGHWNTRLHFSLLALDAANQAGDVRSQADILVYDLGWTYLRIGDLAEAWKHLEKGSALYQGLKDMNGYALATRHLGKAAVEQRDFLAARRLYSRCIRLFRSTRNAQAVGDLQLDVGWMLRLQHKYALSRVCYSRAQRILTQAGDRRGIAKALGGVGNVAVAEGKIDEAVELFSESLRIAEEIRRVDEIAHAQWGLALLDALTGDLRTAIERMERANQLYSTLGTRKDIDDTERVRKEIHRITPGCDIVQYQPR
ncbi:MAG: toll/interleukin-1 receptor domain-containing protein [Acidobacteriia bacterium]|nr:toll/interleukin-1 receptor domain-containing protein [Terriglobia bacterium]